jgi:hypothetical protein
MFMAVGSKIEGNVQIKEEKAFAGAKLIIPVANLEAISSCLVEASDDLRIEEGFGREVGGAIIKVVEANGKEAKTKKAWKYKISRLLY